MKSLRQVLGRQPYRTPRNPSLRTRPAGRLVRVVTPVPGCRVSLLVLMGVMGFLGDLGGEIEIFP